MTASSPDSSRGESLGRATRDRVPRRLLGEWSAPSGRRDPVRILADQEFDRVPELLPIRHERMSASPFAFYRGAAAIMAEDLATRPRTGLNVQLVGDAHLANFGGFATAERTLVFDVNDFDETHPGSFEWDVARFAASFAVVSRHKGFTEAQSQELVSLAARSYAEAMSSFAGMTRLDVWYAKIEADESVTRWGSRLPKDRVAAFGKQLAKGRNKTNARAVSRYTRRGSDGLLSIISQPPFVVPVGELTGADSALIREFAEDVFAQYRETLPSDRRLLLSGYRTVDLARKVVGVGSVGTRCWIALFVADGDVSDDLVLQVKEARASVLEAVTERSESGEHGQRVVEGQRLIQAASDPLLGWTRAPGTDGVVRDFYVRQLWDWKTTADLDAMDHVGMSIYAKMCGWTLARGHARTGDRQAIAAYLGRGKAFARAVALFSHSYAEQNERDYAAFVAAIGRGEVSCARSDSAPGQGVSQGTDRPQEGIR